MHTASALHSVIHLLSIGFFLSSGSSFHHDHHHPILRLIVSRSFKFHRPSSYPSPILVLTAPSLSIVLILSGFAAQPRTRKISHPVYLCQSSKKRLSRDANRSTALRSWAVLALELVSYPSVTTSRGHASLPIRFLFDATTQISLLHILVVCLIFHQPIVQSQLSMALGLQLTEAPSVIPALSSDPKSLSIAGRERSPSVTYPSVF